MKNSELRNLAPSVPVKKASGGSGGLIAQGVVAFALAIGGISLYRNPSLAHGWIPGLGKGKPAAVAQIAPAAALPAGALAALADEKAQAKDEPLTLIDAETAGSAKLAGAMMGEGDTPERQAEIERIVGDAAGRANGMVKLKAAYSTDPELWAVKIFLGGKTSHAMWDKCRALNQPSSDALREKPENIAKFTNCYLTSNVERLCAGAQRQALADVLGHYYKTRAFWVRRADEKLLGSSDPKPVDWAIGSAKTISENVGRLVAQGYLSREDFGWFPDDELKAVLNSTKAEAAPCGAQRT